MTDNELTYAAAGVHTLFVGTAKMNAFPDACVDDFIDSLREPGPEMIEGRMKNFYAAHVLVEQPFVKDNAVSVADVLKKGNVTITRFVNWKLGKG